jgi:uncharacterized protein YbjT (DUF2867 family)
MKLTKSNMETFLVTGATGNIGSRVVSQLLTKGARVRALTRNPESANLPPEVEIVRGDLSDPATFDRCLDGVDAVFLVWLAPVAAAASALAQIAKCARRIVFLSSPHRTPHPFFQQPNPMATLHAEIERLIQTSGLQWIFLRPGAFAINARNWWAQQIRQGDIVRWPYAAAATAPIHECDVASVAVRALCEDGHAEAEYVLTGPQSLTQKEQVSVIGEVIGRPLRFEEISPDGRNVRCALACLLPSQICCSTRLPPPSVNPHSSHPQLRRSLELRHSRSMTGRLITLPSFVRR